MLPLHEHYTFSEAYGKALEHLIFLELRSYLDYRRFSQPLSYWRSRSGLAVGFVVGDETAIVVKGTRKVHTSDHKGLNALSEEAPLRRKIIIANESTYRQLDNGIEIIPTTEFLRALWDDEIVKN